MLCVFEGWWDLMYGGYFVGLEFVYYFRVCWGKVCFKNLW